MRPYYPYALDDFELTLNSCDEDQQSTRPVSSKHEELVQRSRTHEVKRERRTDPDMGIGRVDR
jgi:hypothetical protein